MTTAHPSLRPECVFKLEFLAGFFEDFPAREVHKDIGFSMQAIEAEGQNVKDFSDEHCNTVCCIAGWGEKFWPQEINTEFSTTGFRELPLSQRDHRYGELIMPPDWMSAHYTLSDAARVIRYLLSAGKVDWGIVNASHDE